MRGARFVSQHKGNGITIQEGTPDRTIPDSSGRPHVIPGQRRIHVKFEHRFATATDVAYAKANMHFKGTVMDAAGRDIDPSYRIGVIDTEVLALQNGWSEEEHQLVIDRLREGVGQDYVEFLREPMTAPWSNYDALEDSDRIVELALATDADLRLVAEYEAEHRNRPEVLQALREAGETEDVVLHA